MLNTGIMGTLAGKLTENGNDDYTVLLLHFDGPDNSVVFNDSSRYGRDITHPVGAVLDDVHYKFGRTSLQCRVGGTDYVSADDSDDFYFGTGDFTIDCWIYFSALPAEGAWECLCAQGADDDNRFCWILYNNSGTYEWKFNQRWLSNQDPDMTVNAISLSDSVWYHVAIIRNGSSFKIFQDGIQCGSTVTSSATMQNHTGDFYVGIYRDATSGETNGWIDEFRVSKGVARWTTTFNPPVKAYGGAGNDSYTKLLLHGEGADGSIFINDASWYNPKSITRSTGGDVQVDTSQAKIGTGSIIFDGTGDYLTAPNSADWNLVDGDFTIDFWYRIDDLPAAFDCIFSNRENTGDYSQGFAFFLRNDLQKVYFSWYDSDNVGYTITSDNTYAADTWYHIAAVRYNNILKLYVNGVAQSTTRDLTGKTNKTEITVLTIGRDGNYEDYYFTGWVDEFRWSKGIARWRENFTPPTRPYV
jgi:hypothetical protein